MSNRLDTLLELMPRHFAHDSDSNNYRLLKIIAQHSEDNRALYDTVLKYWDVDQAEGQSLDRLGKDEGISRGGWDDEEYRKMIKIQCIVNLSEGDIDTINLILDAYMGKDFIGIQEMWNDPRQPEPAALKAKSNFDTDTVPKGLLKRIKPAGVRAYWVSYIFEQIKYSILNLVYARIHLTTSSNPWAFAGAIGEGVEKIILDGKYLLNGERFLNSFVKTNGPAYLSDIRLVMSVVHDFGVHEVTVSPILDGEYHLNGEILLQNGLQTIRLSVKQEATIKYKQYDIVHLLPKQNTPTLCKVKATSGINTLNGSHNLDGNIAIDQALFEHSGLFRIKKSGITVEEVAI